MNGQQAPTVRLVVSSRQAVRAASSVSSSSARSPSDALGYERFVAHGTTQGLNRLYTRSGAKVGLLTTRGHEDAVFIGRVFQKVAGLGEREVTNIAALRKPQPLVARNLVYGITERIDCEGDVVVELETDKINVEVSAPGFTTQKRTIKIKLDGVTDARVHRAWVGDPDPRGHHPGGRPVRADLDGGQGSVGHRNHEAGPHRCAPD